MKAVDNKLASVVERRVSPFRSRGATHVIEIG